MQSPTHPKKHPSWLWLVVMVTGLSVLLAGCGGSAATPVVVQAPTATATHTLPTATSVPPTVTPAPPTATATSNPTRTPTLAPTDTAASTASLPAATEELTAVTNGNLSFAADIQPIFTERCIKCHSGENAPRGLHLDSYDGAIAGGTYRKVIEPGSSADSQLVKRITGETTPRMPFDGPPFLDDDQIALIITWIDVGAPDN